MAIYHRPATVLSPRDCVSDVQVIFDGGTGSNRYSVAELKWRGRPCIGIRWNITERELNDPAKVNNTKTCIGEPNSRGYATWFILPDGFLEALLQRGGDVREAIQNYLDE